MASAIVLIWIAIVPLAYLIVVQLPVRQHRGTRRLDARQLLARQMIARGYSGND